MIGWDDAPHLQPPHLTKQELDDIERDMLPHQRQARRTGRPSLGAGAIYPIEEDSIFVEPFKIPDHWARGWAMDVGWNRTAALWGALDEDSETYYLTHEYYVAEAKPVIHAHSIKAVHPWRKLIGAIDPASAGSNQRDGSKLMVEYEDLGLELMKANNAVSAGIHRCLVLMQSGQLKVFTSLEHWRKEFRLYRRNEKGKIIKENDHLMDDTRYLLNTDGLFTTRPQQVARTRTRGEW